MNVSDFSRQYVLAAILACAALPTALGQNCPGSQSATLPLKTGNLSVQKIGSAVLFQAGMSIDADGAPNAYGPNDSGLDLTKNAWSPKKNAWVGFVTANGNPVPQKTGPYQGYYVSQTSLRTGSDADPSEYVDATKIPYIALPPSFADQFGVVVGDLALVVNEANGKSAYAIYADVGNSGEIGEGSIALASALGFKNSSPRNGGVDSGIQFLVFPKSGLGQGKLRTLDEINGSASQLFAKWGGADRLRACSSFSAKLSGIPMGCSWIEAIVEMYRHGIETDHRVLAAVSNSPEGVANWTKSLNSDTAGLSESTAKLQKCISEQQSKQEQSPDQQQ